jgi:hypothetical protein
MPGVHLPEVHLPKLAVPNYLPSADRVAAAFEPPVAKKGPRTGESAAPGEPPVGLSSVFPGSAPAGPIAPSGPTVEVIHGAKRILSPVAAVSASGANQ